VLRALRARNDFIYNVSLLRLVLVYQELRAIICQRGRGLNLDADYFYPKDGFWDIILNRP
jgi:hypothetical protein